MGLILIGLFIVNLLAFAIAMSESNRDDGKTVFKWLSPIFSTIILCAAGLTMWTSYTTYVELRATYDATIEQYATSVEMYGDKAVIDVSSAAWTDFKYQGYQKNIASFITSLRTEVATYNKALIRKRKFSENWFFGWLIVPPDADMKIISMKTAQSHPIKGE